MAICRQNRGLILSRSKSVPPFSIKVNDRVREKEGGKRPRSPLGTDDLGKRKPQKGLPEGELVFWDFFYSARGR